MRKIFRSEFFLIRTEYKELQGKCPIQSKCGKYRLEKLRIQNTDTFEAVTQRTSFEPIMCVQITSCVQGRALIPLEKFDIPVQQPFLLRYTQ